MSPGLKEPRAHYQSYSQPTKHTNRTQKEKHTLSTNALRFDLQTTLVNQVERFDRVPRLYDTRDVNLACALTDHLDIDVALCEGLEHPSRHAHQVTHLFPDEREDRHVCVNRNLSRSTSEFQNRCEDTGIGIRSSPIRFFGAQRLLGPWFSARDCLRSPY